MIGRDEQLALAYAPASLRPAFAALLAFDATLGQVFKLVKAPALIQLRLAWWREELGNKAARDPVLIAVNRLIGPDSLCAADLVRIVDGWEGLLADPPLGDADLGNYARDRGGGLFAAAARLAACDVMPSWGEGWALADLARHCSDHDTAARAMALAQARLDKGVPIRMPAPLRPFALLARFARGDCRRPLDRQARAGSPRRALVAIGFVLSGR